MSFPNFSDLYLHKPSYLSKILTRLLVPFMKLSSDLPEQTDQVLTNGDELLTGHIPYPRRYSHMTPKTASSQTSHRLFRVPGGTGAVPFPARPQTLLPALVPSGEHHSPAVLPPAPINLQAPGERSPHTVPPYCPGAQDNTCTHCPLK